MTAIEDDKNTSNTTDGIRRDKWGWPNSSISATGTVKTGAGVLKRIIVNSTSTGTMKLYNATSADAGNILSNTITPAAGSIIEYNALFTNGLHIVIANTLDITVIYG